MAERLLDTPIRTTQESRRVARIGVDQTTRLGIEPGQKSGGEMVLGQVVTELLVEVIEDLRR